MSKLRFGERIWDSVTGFVPWLLATLAIAGVTHIVSILAMPRLAPRDSFARIAAIAPAFSNTPLPDASSANGAPFDDPALAASVCRYDLARGPARLRGVLAPDDLLLFSFYSRYGDLFYSMTDRGATRGRLEILVLTREQLNRVEEDDSEDELPQELRLVSPTLEGFVLLRSLAERPGDREDAKKRVASIGCGLEAAGAKASK